MALLPTGLHIAKRGSVDDHRVMDLKYRIPAAPDHAAFRPVRPLCICSAARPRSRRHRAFASRDSTDDSHLEKQRAPVQCTSRRVRVAA